MLLVPASVGVSKSDAAWKVRTPVAALIAKRDASAPPMMAQAVMLTPLTVVTAVWFSFTETADEAAAAPPEGPVIRGSTTSVTVTATLCVAVPPAVVART